MHTETAIRESVRKTNEDVKFCGGHMVAPRIKKADSLISDSLATGKPVPGKADINAIIGVINPLVREISSIIQEKNDSYAEIRETQDIFM